MLALSRRLNDGLVINNDIVITVVEIRDDKVRLGITCPKAVPVHRQEVYEAIHGPITPVETTSTPPAPEVNLVSTSVDELVQELGSARAESKAKFTNEGGILPSKPPREKMSVLRDRAQSLFDHLLRAARRETLVKLTKALSRLLDSKNKERNSES